MDPELGADEDDGAVEPVDRAVGARPVVLEHLRQACDPVAGRGAPAAASTACGGRSSSWRTGLRPLSSHASGSSERKSVGPSGSHDQR